MRNRDAVMAIPEGTVAMRLTILPVFVAAALLATGCSAATQQAAQTPPTPKASGSGSNTGPGSYPNHSAPVDANGWVTYHPKGGSVENPRVFEMKGKKASSGGCQFAGHLTLKPGENAVVLRQLALKLSTCEARVEQGTPSQALLDALAKSSSQQKTESQHKPATATGKTTGQRDSSAQHSAGYEKAWYEDPVLIQVNSVQTSTDWHWTGTDVVPPVDGSESLGWFAGWMLQEHAYENSYTTQMTKSLGSAHFSNSAFCQFEWPYFTDTYFRRAEVQGYADGTLNGEWNDMAGGACLDFLSFNTLLQRTLN